MSLIPAPADPSKTHRVIAIAYGIVCHTLFVVGVGTMMVTMFFGMSRSFGRVPTSWSALTNAMLLIQFAFVHSLLMSPFGATILKRLAHAMIGSRMATTIYAILASIQIFMLFALWTPSGVIWWRAMGIVFWFMSSLYIRLGALSLRHAVPAIFSNRPFVTAGGLISYGGDATETYRLVGIYTGKILKGEKPGDLPVQRATKVELIINLKTAKALGIVIPLALSGRADELIE